MKDSMFEELGEEELAVVAGGCGKSRRMHCSRKTFEENLETIRISSSSSSSSVSIIETTTYRTTRPPVTITIKYLPEIDRYT